MISILRRCTVDSWRRIDSEWIEEPTERYDWRPLIVLVTVSVALTLQTYYGYRGKLFELFPIYAASGTIDSLAWSTGWSVLGCVLLPLLAIRFTPGERIRDYLLSFKNVLQRLWIYLIVLGIGLPLVMSYQSSDVFAFHLQGPRYWYHHVVQLVACEFLFRCFILRMLAPRSGSAAIFAMMVPYCMFHFGKAAPDSFMPVISDPMWQALAALVIALVLGSRALSSRSAWGTSQVVTVMSQAKNPNWLVRLLRRVTVDAWRRIDADWIEKPKEGSYDWRPLIVLATVCVSLTLQEYYGHRGKFAELSQGRYGEFESLMSFAWWSGWRFFGYVILPLMAIALMPGERVRDYFISFKNFTKHLWIYVVLFAIVFPAVVVASQTDSFSKTYPFYKLANRSSFDFWAWQALYALQFLSLEFFFRGFMLKALAPRFGSTAIFVMIVPYCMIHFGKPMPETLGAIVAGIALGTLALRTRSIWGGVLIHVGVAVSMDLLAVGHCPPASSGLSCPDH